MRQNVIFSYLVACWVLPWQSMAAEVNDWERAELEVTRYYRAMGKAFRIYDMNRSKEENFYMGVLRDIGNLAEESLVLVRQSKETLAITEDKTLLVAKGDTTQCSDPMLYRTLSGKLSVARLHPRSPYGGRDLTHFSECKATEVILPPLPYGVEEWDHIALGFSDSIDWAESLKKDKKECWRIEGDAWVPHANIDPYSDFLALIPMQNGTPHQYLFRYNAASGLLTIEHFNAATRMFEPTNVKDHPGYVFQTEQHRIKFINPTTVMAIPTGEEGIKGLHFFEEAGAEKEKYDALCALLATQEPCASNPWFLAWDASYSYNNRISFMNDYYNSWSLRDGTLVNEGAAFGGLRGDLKSVFHKPLTLSYSDKSRVPYYHVTPLEWNGSSLVIGDENFSHYQGEMTYVVSDFLKNGWSLIIPQPIGHRGFGYDHYRQGFGEIGRRALHQMLEVFDDAHKKGYINTSNLHFYGSGDGGFLGASLALRWEKLKTESGFMDLPPLQSIVVDELFLPTPHDGAYIRKMCCWDFGDKAAEDANLSLISPLTYATNPLSARLVLLPFWREPRSVDPTPLFSKTLREAGQAFDEFSAIERSYKDVQAFSAFLYALMAGTGDIEAKTALAGLRDMKL